MKNNYFLIVILSIVVGVTLVYGFIDGGSPQAARNKRLDDTAITNIQTINYAVRSFYRQNNLLPTNLGQIKESLTNLENQIEFTYSTVGLTQFKICGTFKTDTTKFKTSPNALTHPVGNYCFDFNVNDNN